MSDRNKKIIFAVFFILFSIGMGYGMYYLFFRMNAAPSVPATPEQLAGGLPSAGTGGPTVGATTTQPGGLPSAGETGAAGEAIGALPSETTKIHLLHDGITQSVAPEKDGTGARFYNPEDGRFYKVNADGSITLLGDKQYFNVDKVDWGNTKDEVIVEFPDGSNYYYNFEEQKQVVLPQHWEEFQFAPNDSKIESKSIGVDADNRYLITANPDGTEAKAIEPLGEDANNAHLSWSPNGQIVAYSDRGQISSDNQQQVIFVGQNHENFKSINTVGRGFLPNWSPTGKQILYSVYGTDSRNKPTLWVVSGEPNTIGANRRTIELNTWADKCAWTDDTTVYCAVPQNLPDNAALSRTEFQTLPDDVYRINVNTGAATKLLLPDLTHAIRNPIVTKDGSQMIFSDAATGKLYSYDLK